MADKNGLSASLEDYLEAIYQVIQEKHSARAKDVADRLAVAAPSVTNALHALKERDLVNHAPYDLITLTTEGNRIAKQVVHRHEVLKTFFTHVLSVEDGIAEDCACKMEHVVPDIVLERFVEYIRFEERCQMGGTTWVDGEGFVCHMCSDDGGQLCAACTKVGYCMARRRGKEKSHA